ncbi:MAG: flagellar biosynthesis regulator FlaF [Rhodospirillales bacterium]
MSLGDRRKAHHAAQASNAKAQSTEALALIEAARRLNAARDAVETNVESYRESLRLNWRLWTIIQCDVASAENNLPDELKANIVSLSIFVDRQTLDALNAPAASKLGILIDINRNVAAGLAARPESPVAPVAPTPAEAA